MRRLDLGLAVLIRGGGEMASGAAQRLFLSGFRVGILELAAPLAVRRLVSFAEAIPEGRVSVEGVAALRIDGENGFRALMQSREAIPVAVDPAGALIGRLHPDVVLDARMAKRNLGTSVEDAPFVVALGPGFIAGQDVHAVIETERGHDLGRVIWEGGARPDSKDPYPLAGVSSDRVLRAPRGGVLRALREIGNLVALGDVVAEIEGEPVTARVGGLLRGLIRNGSRVEEGFKIGDVDPRGESVDPRLISDKARAIAGGVLEAILAFHAGARS